METLLKNKYKKISTYISNSVQDTINYAKKIAEMLVPGDIVGFIGNLGSGKTHFIKGIAGGFGIKGDKVISPTFSIVKEYNSETSLFHFDFYRINNIKELYGMGFRNYFENEEAIIFVEWADKIREIEDNYSYIIKLINNGKKSRRISVYKKKGKRY